MNGSSTSIVLPSKNEAASLRGLLPQIRTVMPDAEVIVVDDGSDDETARICEEAGVITVRHPYSMGNGAAVKSGARHARGDVLVLMDADGQHQAEDIPKLVAHLAEGYDMVVGKRSAQAQASIFRRLANGIYNWLASRMVGHSVEDLTSGMRAVRTERFREYLYLLPNGFSYPTTITMAFFRAGYRVDYTPINVLQRKGKSHIRLLHDGFRFMIIIFKIGTLYSPLKLFTPLAGVIFLSGTSYYLFTYATMGRFTNMSALLLTLAFLVFLIGLVSEQVTTLLFALKNHPNTQKEDS